MKKYVLDGFKTPAGIDTSEDVMHLQRVLGVTQDGVWGPKTQNAYDKLIANTNTNTYPKPSIYVDTVNMKKSFAPIPEMDIKYQGSYVMPGVTTPKGIDPAQKVAAVQKSLGLKVGGIGGYHDLPPDFAHQKC